VSQTAGSSQMNGDANAMETASLLSYDFPTS
jgi:hypothetical protein